MIGACLFVVGAVSPWHSFEHLGGVMNRLEKLNNSGPDQPIPQPVPPEKQWHASTAGGVVAPTPVAPLAPPAPPAPTPQPQPVAPPPPAQPAANLGIEPVLRASLVAAGRANQRMQFNPNAAIQKRIVADGFVPNSQEFSLDVGGRRYVGQQAEHLRTGEVRVYYVQEGLWDEVQFVGQAAG